MKRLSLLKITWKLVFGIIISILALIIIFKTVSPQNKNDNNISSAVKSAFSDQLKNIAGTVSEQNDLSIWWISPDNLNIINENTSGIQLETKGPDSSQLCTGFKETALNLSQNINKIMESNGYILNSLNSSTSIDDEKFYDYIQAYEKGATKCEFTANRDCYQLENKADYGNYFYFSCTDQFAKNYEEQAPFLKDLNIKDSIIHIQKRSGDFVNLNVNYRRTGHYTIAQLVNGKWQELFSGQEYPSCKTVEKYQIPKEIYIQCNP